MIIKEADDKKPAILALQALLARPDCRAETRARIDQEIRNIQAGVRGEDEAAYEIRVRWGQSKNWMAIHDLRVDYDGIAAQIDHLLINRFMEIWVCESKHFSEGVAINEHGEFAAFFGNKAYGVPSPIEQNAKHILILRKLIESGAVRLPTRLGFAIKPNFKSLVLVSKRARISRPKAKVEGVEAIVKTDQVFTFIDKAIDQNSSPLLMARVIGQETLEALARDIASLHRPIAVDWAARFGLPNEAPAPPPAKPAPVTAAPSPAAPLPVAPSPQAATSADAAQPKPRQKLICHACGASLTYNVAKYCWGNKPRFGGNLYCFSCQKTVPAG